jgi:ABC-2 type transport system ATP-binding protein
MGFVGPNGSGKTTTLKLIMNLMRADGGEVKVFGQDYIRRFDLDERKKIKELSRGMRTKYALTLALSHRAELLIMDEPTAGLDPVFRRELLDILQDVMQREENSILFSSHITSDLDRIADYITFINDGQIIFSQEKDQVFESYVLVKGGLGDLTPELELQMIGISRRDTGFEGLMIGRPRGEGLVLEKPTLEDIMFFHTKGANHGR